MRAADAVDPLIAVLNTEIEKTTQNIDLMKKVISALTKIGDRKAMPVLIKIFTVADLQGDLIQSYGTMTDARAVGNLSAFLKNGKDKYRNEAITALGKIGDDNALDALINSLNSISYRSLVIETIGNFPGDKVYDILLKKLADADDEISHAAERAMAMRKDKHRLRLLLLRAGKMPERGQSIAYLLKRHMLADDTNVLLDYIGDSDKEVSKGAIQIIGMIGDTNKGAMLSTFLKDPDSDIRTVAQEAISLIEKRKAFKMRQTSKNDHK
jgi:HEAT repeat protein